MLFGRAPGGQYCRKEGGQGQIEAPDEEDGADNGGTVGRAQSKQKEGDGAPYAEVGQCHGKQQGEDGVIEHNQSQIAPVLKYAQVVEDEPKLEVISGVAQQGEGHDFEQSLPAQLGEGLDLLSPSRLDAQAGPKGEQEQGQYEYQYQGQGGPAEQLPAEVCQRLWQSPALQPQECDKAAGHQHHIL